MRTTMLLSLLLVAMSMTAVFLVLVRVTVERQLRDDLADETRRSEATFANLQAQRRRLLERTAGLMADLPSLKALMTARDRRTIEDGGAEFAGLSGSTVFALSDERGRLVSFYNQGARLDRVAVEAAATEAVARPGTPHLLASRGRLMEVLSEPVEFGSAASGFRLGYVTVGYGLDHAMAEEIGQAASAQVAFIGDEGVVASTLPGSAERGLAALARAGARRDSEAVWLGQEHYLARVIPLGGATGGPLLVVLKSYDEATRTLRRLRSGIVLIGIFGLLVGSALAAWIATTVTRPLESLLEGTRALGAGDFGYVWTESGAAEVRGLSAAFRRMQGEIERTQRELLLAERMATIGRMASAISHDLRHYLTSMYANAEFLSMGGRAAEAREEMLDEVKTAVMGMTDLLDSLLVFGRTGMALETRPVDPVEILERAIARVRLHPEARGVAIEVRAETAVVMTADARELDRAAYNVVLNGCQGGTAQCGAAARAGDGGGGRGVAAHPD